MKIGKTQQRVLNNIALYEEFILIEYTRGQRATVTLQCIDCEHIFVRYAHSFNTNPHMCPQCRPKGTSQRLTLQKSQERIDNIYGNGLYKQLSYEGNNVLIELLCNNCNEIFTGVPSALWRNRHKGCPICNKTISLGESAVKTYLERNKIQYIQQYRYIDCKNMQPLPFDFFLPQRNILIEFQGEQHYLKKSLFYSDQTVINDQIKEQYAKDRNISLLCISYLDLNKIDIVLDDFLKEH